jgi:hypothetical protein
VKPDDKATRDILVTDSTTEGDVREVAKPEVGTAKVLVRPLPLGRYDGGDALSEGRARLLSSAFLTFLHGKCKSAGWLNPQILY